MVGLDYSIDFVGRAISTKNTLNYQYVEHKLLDKIKKDDENN